MPHTGEEFLDTVTLAPGLVITNQSLGAAIEDRGFDGVDGIIGYASPPVNSMRSELFFSIGPVDRTCGKYLLYLLLIVFTG